MRRALFVREFRSALVQSLVILGAILVTLIVIERMVGPRFGKPEEVHASLNVFLLLGLTLAGFVGGERCFPPDIKGDRLYFLSSLPLSRGATWLAIVSARLCGLLLAIGAVFLARLPLVVSGGVERNPERNLTILILGSLPIVAFLMLFLAGTTFALLFRRAVQAYVLGIPAMVFVAIEISLASFYASTPSFPRDIGWVILPGEMPVSIVTSVLVFSLVCASFLSAVLAVLSRYLFMRGEIGSPKLLAKHLLLIPLGLSGTLMLFLLFATQPALARLGDSWSFHNPWPFDWSFWWGTTQLTPEVSPDGRLLFVVEHLSHRPRFSRITILDLKSGRLSGRWEGAGLLWTHWSSPGALDILVVNSSPWDRWGYLKEGSTDWVRLNSKAREIARRRLDRVEQVAPLLDGRLLLVLRTAGDGRIVTLGSGSGELEELAHGRLEGRVSIRRAGPGMVVRFDNTPGPSQTWIVRSKAREISGPKVDEPSWAVFFGKLYDSVYRAHQELPQRFLARPKGEGRPQQGIFLFPPDVVLDEGQRPFYFVEREEGKFVGTLWAVTPKGEGRWTRLTSGLPVPPRFYLGVSSNGGPLPFDQEVWPQLAIDFETGIAAYVSRSANGGIGAFDPAVGSSFRIGNGCENGEIGRLAINRVRGLEGLLVKLLCISPGTTPSWRSLYFQYLPGSGAGEEIKEFTALRLEKPLYLEKNGVEIWATADGHLWRSTPGAPDQLLWSPRSAS